MSVERCSVVEVFARKWYFLDPAESRVATSATLPRGPSLIPRSLPRSFARRSCYLAEGAINITTHKEGGLPRLVWANSEEKANAEMNAGSYLCNRTKKVEICHTSLLKHVRPGFRVLTSSLVASHIPWQLPGNKVVSKKLPTLGLLSGVAIIMRQFKYHLNNTCQWVAKAEPWLEWWTH